jgi:hypothetical protein
VEKENILESKMDSLMRTLEKMEIEKIEAQDLKATEPRSTCEECGEYGHVRKDCLEEAKTLDYMRKGELSNFRYGQDRPQFNAISSIPNSVPLRIQLKEFMDEQAKINKDTVTKFKTMDNVLENIDSKVTDVGSSNHQVLNMMKMLETQLGKLAGASLTMKGSFQDNSKVPNRRRPFKHARERRPKIRNVPREQGSLNHPPRWKELLKRRLLGSSPKNPNLRCRRKTRGYRNSSHATSEVNLTTTLRSL